nr:ribonuclease H-like domain-containing protein [Tanacetum cinerariifolium]
MLDEYNALIKNGTWILVPKPAGVNMVRSMWLFKHKFHANGTLSRYKARLVANGSSQQQGIDVDETFSPVVKPATIRTVLSLAVSHKWPIHQLDVKNGFLNGYAIRAGFYHSRCDTSLFIYQQGSQVAYLLIYVDDIILTASSAALLQQIITSLHQEFDMTDLGALNYFLGIPATRSSTGLFLSQKKYACELLEHANMVNYNPSQTPVDTDSKLGPERVTVQDPTLYRSLARGLYVEAEYRGVANVVAETAWLRNLLRELHSPLSTATLVYCDNTGHIRVLHVPFHYQYADIFTKGLSITLFEDFRSSLSVRLPPAQTAGALRKMIMDVKKFYGKRNESVYYSVLRDLHRLQVIPQKLHHLIAILQEPHFAALKRILRYVWGTVDFGLQLYASATTSLVGAEAEYHGVANVVVETTWLRNLLRELHSPLSTATLVYCDNVSAVYLSANPVQHQRTKRIEIDIHFVRDMVQTGHIRVLHVPSRYQYSDIFTKGLPAALLEDFRSSLSVWLPPAQSVGAY